MQSPMPATEGQRQYTWKQLQPSVARLKVEVIKAVGLGKFVDPYIICIYDHSEAIMSRVSREMIEDEEYNQRPRVKSFFKHETGTASIAGELPRTIHKWKTAQTFDVRDSAMPVEFSIFDRESECFLGRARISRPKVAWNNDPISLTIKDRDGPEEPCRLLQVRFSFLEKGPSLSTAAFDMPASTTNIAKHCETSLTYAVKNVEKDRIDRVSFRQNGRADGFLQPVKYILYKSSTLLSVFVDEAKGGSFADLFSRMATNGRLDGTTAKFYLAEIILALEDLQSCKSDRPFFTLNDLCLDGLGHIAFSDFNMYQVKSTEELANEKDLKFMAPELFTHATCSWTANFWSLGVIMFEIYFGWNPFSASSPALTKEKICYAKDTLRDRLSILAKDEKDFMEGLLSPDPLQRLGARNGTEELKTHSFFIGFDWDKIRRRDVVPPYKSMPPNRHWGKTLTPVESTHPQKSPDLEDDLDAIDTSLSEEKLDIDVILEKQEMLRYAQVSPNVGLSSGSMSSYRTAQSSFGPTSHYVTPASHADLWVGGSAPSIGSFLERMFKAKEEQNLLKPRYKDIVRAKGLQLPLSDEINWSGQGQHVEFGVGHEIPLKELTAIGHGGSALVDSVLCRRVKLARKTMICTRRQKLETMINEVEHLQSLRHPHIIQLVGSYLQGKKFAILLYPVAQWNLSTFLELCQEIESGLETESEKALSFKLNALPGFLPCIAHAMAYVHANTIKHMDMKPQNILVRSNLKGPSLFTVYLADFGISKKFAEGELSQTSGVIALTRKYCAPEVYDGEPRGRAADIFSLGCVFLEIATVIRGWSLDDFAEFRARPLDPRDYGDDESYHGNLEKVENWIGKLRQISTASLERRKGIVQKLEVMQRMIRWNPNERPTASEVLEKLGGPNYCCLQVRETYEAEEPSVLSQQS